MSDPVDIVRNAFINKEGELRSGWRVLVLIIFFILFASMLNAAIRILAALFPSLSFLTSEPAASDEYLSNRELIYLFFMQSINFAAALAASWACARLLEHRSLASIGYKLHRGALRDFALGSILGALSIALAVAIAAVAGAERFEVNARDAARLASGFLILFFFFLLSGAFEELFFRGFAFQALVHNTGAMAAILITSMLFGLAHLSNSGASTFSTINTILAGVWLGVAYLKTRSLWLATGLHYSWNFVMAFVFGLPVSGIARLSQLAWLRGSSQSGDWLSGGNYGPEGGAAVTLVLILCTLAIWKGKLLKPSEEMLAAIEHGKPGPRFISISPDKQAGG